MRFRQRRVLPVGFMLYRTWLVAIFQALLVFSALVFAWFLRFDFSLPYRSLLFTAAPILIVIRLAAIGRFGLFHGWWRYTGMSDALDIIKATAAGSFVFVLVMRFLLGVVAFPRAVYILEAVLSLGLLMGVRLFSRLLTESVSKEVSSRHRVMLIGAGSAAQMLIREIHRLKESHEVVGCVDDDKSKQGMKLQGVPVLGTVDQLPSLLEEQPAHEVLIAVPSANGKQMQRFVDICNECGARFRTVPALRHLITGEASVHNFREVDLEDLLGREPVRVDLGPVREKISGRVVLVSGAAGSIGSELCRQIVQYGPAALVCVDQSETGIFYLEQELSPRIQSGQAIFCVADVSDVERMREIFGQFRPAAVFHAAAYKHVPVMERNVQEAVKNNVFALTNLIDIAEEHGCQRFILISSDKAVNPTSLMGATKRLGELIIASRPTTQMHCVSVRFGNVLGSNGSVVPIFQEQLRRNQPLSITHPEIERFFMTTREAVSLVLQAFAIGRRGDTLVLDMGQPIKILDLARTLIRISGKTESEVRIQFTGLREGEKLCEELFYPAEKALFTSVEKIKRIQSAPGSWAQLKRDLAELKCCFGIDSALPIRRKIQEIVPEYSYTDVDELAEIARKLHPGVFANQRLQLDSLPLDGD